MKKIVSRYLVDYDGQHKTITQLPTTNTPLPTDTKQIMLLAAAEESYSQAAVLLQPALAHVIASVDGWPCQEQLKSGLVLLEEAMGRHDAYAESLQ